MLFFFLLNLLTTHFLIAIISCRVIVFRDYKFELKKPHGVSSQHGTLFRSQNHNFRVGSEKDITHQRNFEKYRRFLFGFNLGPLSASANTRTENTQDKANCIKKPEPNSPSFMGLSFNFNLGQSSLAFCGPEKRSEINVEAVKPACLDPDVKNQGNNLLNLPICETDGNSEAIKKTQALPVVPNGPATENPSNNLKSTPSLTTVQKGDKTFTTVSMPVTIKTSISTASTVITINAALKTTPSTPDKNKATTQTPTVTSTNMPINATPKATAIKSEGKTINITTKKAGPIVTSATIAFSTNSKPVSVISSKNTVTAYSTTSKSTTPQATSPTKPLSTTSTTPPSATITSTVTTTQTTSPPNKIKNEVPTSTSVKPPLSTTLKPVSSISSKNAVAADGSTTMFTKTQTTSSSKSLTTASTPAPSATATSTTATSIIAVTTIQTTSPPIKRKEVPTSTSVKPPLSTSFKPVSSMSSKNTVAADGSTTMFTKTQTSSSKSLTTASTPAPSATATSTIAVTTIQTTSPPIKRKEVPTSTSVKPSLNTTFKPVSSMSSKNTVTTYSTTAKSSGSQATSSTKSLITASTPSTPAPSAASTSAVTTIQTTSPPIKRKEVPTSTSVKPPLSTSLNTISGISSKNTVTTYSSTTKSSGSQTTSSTKSLTTASTLPSSKTITSTVTTIQTTSLPIKRKEIPTSTSVRPPLSTSLNTVSGLSGKNTVTPDSSTTKSSGSQNTSPTITLTPASTLPSSNTITSTVTTTQTTSLPMKRKEIPTSTMLSSQATTSSSFGNSISSSIQTSTSKTGITTGQSLSNVSLINSAVSGKSLTTLKAMKRADNKYVTSANYTAVYNSTTANLTSTLVQSQTTPTLFTIPATVISTTAVKFSSTLNNIISTLKIGTTERTATEKFHTTVTPMKRADKIFVPKRSTHTIRTTSSLSTDKVQTPTTKPDIKISNVEKSSITNLKATSSNPALNQLTTSATTTTNLPTNSTFTHGTTINSAADQTILTTTRLLKRADIKDVPNRPNLTSPTTMRNPTIRSTNVPSTTSLNTASVNNKKINIQLNNSGGAGKSSSVNIKIKSPKQNHASSHKIKTLIRLKSSAVLPNRAAVSLQNKPLRLPTTISIKNFTKTTPVMLNTAFETSSTATPRKLFPVVQNPNKQRFIPNELKRNEILTTGQTSPPQLNTIGSISLPNITPTSPATFQTMVKFNSTGGAGKSASLNMEIKSPKHSHAASHKIKALFKLKSSAVLPNRAAVNSQNKPLRLPTTISIKYLPKTTPVMLNTVFETSSTATTRKSFSSAQNPTLQRNKILTPGHTSPTLLNTIDSFRYPNITPTYPAAFQTMIQLNSIRGAGKSASVNMDVKSPKQSHASSHKIKASIRLKSNAVSPDKATVNNDQDITSNLPTTISIKNLPKTTLVMLNSAFKTSSSASPRSLFSAAQNPTEQGIMPKELQRNEILTPGQTSPSQLNTIDSIRLPNITTTSPATFQAMIQLNSTGGGGKSALVNMDIKSPKQGHASSHKIKASIRLKSNAGSPDRATVNGQDLTSKLPTTISIINLTKSTTTIILDAEVETSSTATPRNFLYAVQNPTEQGIMPNELQRNEIWTTGKTSPSQLNTINSFRLPNITTTSPAMFQAMIQLNSTGGGGKSPSVNMEMESAIEMAGLNSDHTSSTATPRKFSSVAQNLTEPINMSNKLLRNEILNTGQTPPSKLNTIDSSRLTNRTRGNGKSALLHMEKKFPQRSRVSQHQLNGIKFKSRKSVKPKRKWKRLLLSSFKNRHQKSLKKR